MKPIRILPCQGDSKIVKNQMKKPPLKKLLNQEMKEREGGFILNGDVVNNKLNYDPTNDEHLKQYFVNQRVKQHMNKINKIHIKSNHVSEDDDLDNEDDTRKKEDSSRVLTNNKKISLSRLSSKQPKSDSDARDRKTQLKNVNYYRTAENPKEQQINIQIQGSEYQQYENYYSTKEQQKDKEITQNSQQLELPRIFLNNSNIYNSNSNVQNSNSNNNNNGYNNENFNSSTLNTNTNSSFIYSSAQENNMNQSKIEQRNNDQLKSMVHPKVSNTYSSGIVGLRNKVILRPILNHEKKDKDKSEIMKVYGSAQEDCFDIKHLGMKRNSQQVVNSSSFIAEQENLSYSDYRGNVLKNRIRSITGKKGSKHETIVSTLESNPLGNISMYEGSEQLPKKYNNVYLNAKTGARSSTQNGIQNISSDIENLERINQSKGILSVSKDQFTSFMEQFKQKYKSNSTLGSKNSTQSCRSEKLDEKERKKSEIDSLKKTKKEIIRRQEQELQELEKQIMSYENQENQIKQDIYSLDKEREKLSQDTNEMYYINKIIIPKPKDKDDYVIHEQVMDEDTYRSPPKKHKQHHAEEIEEEMSDEFMYTKPVLEENENEKKKWFGNENIIKTEQSDKINTPEEQVREERQMVIESVHKSKSNKKKKQKQNQLEFDTDELNSVQFQSNNKDQQSEKKENLMSGSIYQLDEKWSQRKQGVIEEYLQAKQQNKMNNSQISKQNTSSNQNKQTPTKSRKDNNNKNASENKLNVNNEIQSKQINSNQSENADEYSQEYENE